ncbi:MAG: YbaN family protein [Dehalococcoidales bacterium]|nr:YbaN family protein [Dehalococcoidales bacterium]
MKKTLFLILGTLSVATGVVGIFVPILPTTPFLLLAAACYIRSSQKMYDWLLNNRLLGGYIKNYILGRGMSLKQKIITLSILWSVILISALFITREIVVQLILLFVAIGVTTHIVRIKTLRENLNEERPETG